MKKTLLIFAIVFNITINLLPNQVDAQNYVIVNKFDVFGNYHDTVFVSNEIINSSNFDFTGNVEMLLKYWTDYTIRVNPSKYQPLLLTGDTSTANMYTLHFSSQQSFVDSSAIKTKAYLETIWGEGNVFDVE